MEARALAAHEPAIAAAVQAADAPDPPAAGRPDRGGNRGRGMAAGTDPALAARLFTAGLYGLMAQWHLAPGSFSWDATPRRSPLAAAPQAAVPTPAMVTGGRHRPAPGREIRDDPNAALGLNKGGSVGALTMPARQVHLAVMAAFAETGRAPARGELERTARDQGAEPAAVLAELAAQDVIAFGADSEIRAAYPFSPVPTADPGEMGRRPAHLRHVRHRRARHLGHARPPGHDHRRRARHRLHHHRPRPPRPGPLAPPTRGRVRRRSR